MARLRFRRRKEGRTREALREAVDDWLPVDGGLQVLFQVSANVPVVTLSRNPAVGPRLTPTFFIGLLNKEELHELAQDLAAETGGLSRFMQTVDVGRNAGFLVVPAMYHLDDVDEFLRAMHATLAHVVSEAWLEERCEVVIAHEGVSYRAVHLPDGSLGVEREEADDSDVR